MDMDISSSEDETVVKGPKWDEYVRECYDKLKTGALKASNRDGSYRCPYCYGKKRMNYSYRELIRHAYGHGRGSKAGEIKKKARHLALEKYAEKYLGNKSSGTKEATSSKRDQPVKFFSVSVVPKEKARVISKFPPETDTNEKFVWPWFGVLANLPAEVKDGRSVSESSSKIRDDLVRQGFHPLKVDALWNARGFSGFALVEFGSDWDGFTNAMLFEKAMEAEFRGKRHWKRRGQQNGGQIYGWIARQDDYDDVPGSIYMVRNRLRKRGNLTTIKQKQAEEERKKDTLVEDLNNRLENKDVHIKEIKEKCNKATSLLMKIMTEKDKLTEDYNNAVYEMEKNRRAQYEKVLSDHERSRANLAARKKELIQKEKTLDRVEAQYEIEKEKILREKEMNDRATFEQDQADENVLSLAADQKREMETLRGRILELESKLNAKQALELEIKRLEGSQRVMGEDAEVAKKIEALKEELDEKNEELESIDEMNQMLINKERSSNDELQNARQELIRAFKDLPAHSRSLIGVKRMGDLDGKVFLAATKKKYATEEEAEEKAAGLCSYWEEKLRDPSWHPFKIVIVNERETEVFDEDDELLKQVREEVGEEASEAVKTALGELNEYNPSGRYPVPELWNRKENRRASLKEGAAFILRQFRLHRSKRN